MTFTGLLLRNLRYHWRENLAVFLGIALGAAVLTGALLVGDSLRGSLQDLALAHLGDVDQALIANRFFRSALAKDVNANAAILIQSSATKEDTAGKQVSRAGKVTVLGMDAPPSHLIKLKSPAFWETDLAETIINRTLADDLKVKEGDTIVLQVLKNDAMPRESLLGKRKSEDVVQEVHVKVRQILDANLADFTLKPTPEPVRNAFVPLRFLQEKIGLDGQANVLLAREANSDREAALAKSLVLEDWNLLLRTPTDRARALATFLDPRNEDGQLKHLRWTGRVPEALAQQADGNGILGVDKIVTYYNDHHHYLSLESKSLYLDAVVVEAVKRVVAGARGEWAPYPALIYLADTIRAGDDEVPYALVAGTDAVPGDLKRSLNQKDNEIILAVYGQSPLNAAPGAAVTLTYYVPDERGTLLKKQVSLTYAGAVPLTNGFDDPDLTPLFPGITDKLDMASWENPPFPYEPRRIKARDEDFWKRYRTTPRAFVTLAKAQELWGSRFGKVTSYRLVNQTNAASETAASEFKTRLLQELKPEFGGFVFQNVREDALSSGATGNDFGVYFLSFSVFLILSSLLLVGLLVRLSIERRASEIGLLMATGWSYRKVRWLIGAEGMILAVSGGLAGLAAALWYADILLRWLRSAWPVPGGLRFLTLHTTVSTFIIGYVAAVAVSGATIWWATRLLGRLAPRSLLAGVSETPRFEHATKSRWTKPMIWGGVIGALSCVAAGYVAPGGEAKAMSFFSAGALILTGALAAIRRLLAVAPAPRSLTLLGFGNAGRFRQRSLLTVGLLASAVFLIVAVELFHKDASGASSDRNSGDGGFTFYAESAVPVFEDLNSTSDMKNSTIYSFRARAGDDTSCLNLYRPLQPKIVGVPQTLIGEKRFHFADSVPLTDEEHDNPWLLLNRAEPDGSVPVIADANTAQWILKVPLGGFMEVADDTGKTRKLKIVALLEDSIFQSELLMADRQFIKLYPHEEGFRFFLIDELTASQKTSLSGKNGLEVHRTVERLQAYLGVENTYLATFQALGALGLLLGTLGLAIVVIRGVWERRAEFALLQALGFRRSAIAWLILAENLTLFLLGVGSGLLAAIVAVAPNLAASAGWSAAGRLLTFLILLALAGLFSGGVGAYFSLRTPILTALRRE